MTKMVSKSLSKLFYKFGWKVATYPKIFMGLSVFTCGLLSLGLNNLYLKTDLLDLFKPQSGPSAEEDYISRKVFPEDEDNFSLIRTTQLKNWLRISFVAKNDSNIMTTDCFKEIRKIDDFVKTQKFQMENGESVQFTDICKKFDGTCVDQYAPIDISLVLEKLENTNSSIRISYPIFFNPITFEVYDLASSFGKEELNEDGTSLISAKSFFLPYSLRTDQDEKVLFWLRSMRLELPALSSMEHTDMYFLSGRIGGDDLLESVLEILPFLLLTLLLTFVFVFVSLLSKRQEESKPWLAIPAVISAIMGSISGIGLLSWLGAPFTIMCISIPFTIIAIGIDDAFILIAAWRKTNTHDSVQKRTAETFADASLSITITSLTDAASFLMGTLAPYKAIQIFCMYACVCVLWDYVWQLLFFGPCLALSGFHEEKKRSGIFPCMKTLPFSIGSLNETSSTNKDSKSTSSEKREHWNAEKFLAKLLSNSSFQKLCLVAYVVYICGTIYGLKKLDSSFHMKKLFQSSSPYYTFLDIEDEYVPPSQFPISMMILAPLDYSDKNVQNKIDSILNALSKENEYGLVRIMENWLKSYVSWLEIYAEIQGISEMNSDIFINILREEYLPSRPILAQDVSFDPTNRTIIATRYPVFVKNVHKFHPKPTVALPAFVGHLRAACENLTSVYDVQVLPRIFWSSFIDPSFQINQLSIQLLSMTCVISVLICFIFIPSGLVCCSVFLAVVSIILGQLGFLSLIGVHLDPISLVALIMSIGFSVDFTVHTCHAFQHTEGDPESRFRSTLRSVLHPIFQGSVSTILGISTFIFVELYIFKVILYAVTIVMISSSIHSLIWVPIFLQKFDELKLYVSTNFPFVGESEKYVVNKVIS